MIQYDFDAIIERRGTSCEKWDSYPADILPMWVADSDFRAPLPVIEAIQAVAARGIFGYSKADGKFEAAYAGWMQKRFGWQASPDWVEWCPSQGSALALAIRVFTSPGDNVAMLSPIYPPFIHLCTLNERNPVQSVLHGPGYCIDYCDLEEKLSLPATRLLLLCNPHNPTGRVFTRTELERIGELCLRHGVVVFSDEIHCDFVYAGKHIPFPLLSPELADITLVGINASKTFNLADLRSAAVISSNEKLRQAFAAGRDRVKLGRCSLGVAGVIAAYEKCEDYADQLRVYVSQNISWTVEHLRREMPSIKAYAPEGTFLLWLDCRALGGTQAEREAFFLEKDMVALNAGESFGNGGEGFMRMNLACPRSTVREAMARLQRVS
jgi:cystathionine beta-lyase